MEVASHEAVVRQTYRDSVGVDTWSVGLTNATGHKVGRYINNLAPLQHCLNVFVWALNRYADHVREVFKGHDLNEAQFAAALSFTWNLGGGNLRSATWVKRWKAGDVAGAREAFMWFNKPAEIVGRRRKERDLFFDGKWSNTGKMTEFTRLTSKRTPVWGSAKVIDVRKELVKALQTQAGVTVDQASYEPDQPAATLSPDVAPKPKGMLESTTNWSAIGAFITAVLGALQGLDPWVAAPVILVAGAFAFWIIKERWSKAEEFGI